MNKKLEKIIHSKSFLIAMIVLLIILVISAGTYAWFTWNSTNNTNLTMSIGASSDVVFKNGNDISTNKLAPVFNYTDGESTTFTIINKSTTSFSYRILLNITSIDNELKNKSLKYKLVSNNTIITEGDFSNIENTNKLYEGEITKNSIDFIFYLYIDGNEENDLNMINKSLVGTITVAEATATYQLTNSDGTNYTPSYSGSGTKAVRSNAPLNKFKEVKVDGVTVDSSNYTLTEGSTIVTFKESYLKTLSEGEHTLKVISSDGFASGKISVTKPLFISQVITNLYTNAEKTTTSVNNITYNLAPSVGLMNDRRGSMSTGIDAGNIRYYGASPNNYIYFNCSDYSNQNDTTCEKWRIIGVFDGKVKIIRNEPIGKYSFDNQSSGYGVNEWPNAWLMKILNPGYESAEASLYYNSKPGTCYTWQKVDDDDYSVARPLSCDFTSSGIKNDITKNKIAEVTWNLGGSAEIDIYTDQFYAYERGTAVYSGHSTIWVGRVALAYPSDYGYAADLSLCQKQLSGYYDATCTANNWMASVYTYGGPIDARLLTPMSSDDKGVYYVARGAVDNIPPTIGAGSHSNISPTLFLKSTEVIYENNNDSTLGTENNPYKLSGTSGNIN